MELVLFLLAAFSFSKYFATTEPIVTINDGAVSGKYLTTKGGRTFTAFMGIPFAKPPVGPLRFEPPQPVDPWRGTLNGTTPHGVCLQRNIFIKGAGYQGAEDCLFLNVYTPNISNFETAKLPVMVFLHGGGLVCGSGNYYSHPPEVLLDRDVLLVTTNYRLGVFGFFSTGDEVVPGNNGFKDQSFALKWVQNNIKQFGGDPGSVTIFGESAGGASVHYQLLSPLSRGLFKGAIIQSGTAVAPWSIAGPTERQDNSLKLAKLLNCPATSSQELVKCLQNADANDILRKDVAFEIWDYDPTVPFKPVIEPNIAGAFLTKQPRAIIESGEAADVPIIIGVNRDEGAMKSARLYGSPELLEEFGNNFTILFPIALQYDKWFPTKNFDSVSFLLDGFYFEHKKIDNSKTAEITNLFSDDTFFYPADTAIRLHTQHYKQPVYVYLFGYRGSYSYSTILGGGDKNFGVCHGDDLLYLFSIDYLFHGAKPSENDKRMSNLLTNLWTNFARTGNPTPKENSDGLVPWPPYGAQEEFYEFTNDTSAKISFGGIAPARMNFWKQLLSMYGNKAN